MALRKIKASWPSPSMRFTKDYGGGKEARITMLVLVKNLQEYCLACCLGQTLTAASCGNKRVNAINVYNHLLEKCGNRCDTAVSFATDHSCRKIPPQRGLLKKFHATSRQDSLALASQEQAVRNHENSQPIFPTEDEDDFAELGLPVQGDGDAGSKLEAKMHKASLIVKTETHRKWANQLVNKITNSEASQKQDGHLPASVSNLEDCNGFSTSKNETKLQKWFPEKDPDHKSSSCITVEQVPSCITLSELREAVSVYGTILRAFLGTAQNGFNSCNIEFESTDSVERALVAQWVTVRNHNLPIHHLHLPKIIAVRISNISLATAEPTIHSVCSKCGSVEGLLRTKEGAVEVLFDDIKDFSVVLTILNKLNDVSVDGCQWSAQFLSERDPDSSSTTSEGHEIGSQMIDLLGDLKKQLEMKRIYLEDLEGLHQAVVHLRDCPAAAHRLNDAFDQ